MNAVVRLARFAGVGVVATLIHYVVLESLFWLWQLLGLANFAAFLIACAFRSLCSSASLSGIACRVSG
jgi:putative flippase GtrA